MKTFSTSPCSQEDGECLLSCACSHKHIREQVPSMHLWMHSSRPQEDARWSVLLLSNLFLWNGASHWSWGQTAGRSQPPTSPFHSTRVLGVCGHAPFLRWMPGSQLRSWCLQSTHSYPLSSLLHPLCQLSSGINCAVEMSWFQVSVWLRRT